MLGSGRSEAKIPISREFWLLDAGFWIHDNDYYSALITHQ